jgi:hypothetical protein
MKLSIILILFLASFVVKAQPDSLIKFFGPEQTAFGSPAGEKISNDIGPDGGTIISSDKMAELIIPKGALTVNIIISVQPVTNAKKTGIGNAYQFLPEGLQFLRPATLVFHYPHSEDAQISPVLQNISWQDKEGYWYQLKKIKLDTINKFISGEIKHFSQYCRSNDFEINPGTAQARVNNIIYLHVMSGIFPDRLGETFDITSPQTTQEQLDAFRRFQDEISFAWYVNNVNNGNSVYGTITPSGTPRLGSSFMINYNAPAVMPEENPVTVKVVMRGPITLANGIVLDHAEATAKITIIDEFRYTFYGQSTRGILHMRDSSSCIIKLDGKNVTVSDIRNYPAWSDWPANPDGCNWNYTNKDNWKGLVEIGGVASAVYAGRSPRNPVAVINITLVPAMGNTPSAIVTCPGGSPTNVPSMPTQAMPNYIRFDIDEENKVIVHYGNRTGVNELKAISGGDGFIIRIKRLQ